MTNPASTDVLRVLRVNADKPEAQQMQPTGNVMRLVNGSIVATDQGNADSLLQRFRAKGTPYARTDSQVWDMLRDGGWSNGYVAIVPGSAA